MDIGIGFETRRRTLARYQGRIDDYAMRSGAPLEVVENLEELEDEGEIYETIEDVWPDYPTKEDFLFNERRILIPLSSAEAHVAPAFFVSFAAHCRPILSCPTPFLLQTSQRRRGNAPFSPIRALLLSRR